MKEEIRDRLAGWGVGSKNAYTFAFLVPEAIAEETAPDTPTASRSNPV
jgi:hypothetical protein